MILMVIRKRKKGFYYKFKSWFLSSSYSSIESQNNYYIEHSSFSENSFSFKSWKIKGINIKENESKKIKFKKDEIIVIDLRYIFYECSLLLSIIGLSKINTSNVKKMKHMLEDCSLLKKVFDISQWDTNKVKDISCMFAGCSSLKSLPDISNWNTEQFEYIEQLFQNAHLWYHYLTYLNGILTKWLILIIYSSNVHY